MLHHPTVDKLHALRLPGMAAALAEQQSQDGIDRLGFALESPLRISNPKFRTLSYSDQLIGYDFDGLATVCRKYSSESSAGIGSQPAAHDPSSWRSTAG